MLGKTDGKAVGRPIDADGLQIAGRSRTGLGRTSVGSAEVCLRKNLKLYILGDDVTCNF